MPHSLSDHCLTIVTTNSLFRQEEKARESGEIPWWALAGSLGLHALALGVLSGAPVGEGAGVAPAEPLRAALRAPPGPTGAAAETAARAAPSVPRQRLSAPVDRQAGDVIPPAPMSLASRADDAGSTGDVALPGGVPAEPSASGPATVALDAHPDTHGPDAAGLRQYRLALAGEARRFRNYPEAARRAGLAGTAEVRVGVAAGAPRQTELARSSGHAMLDVAAVEMLRAAAARAALPESLRGQTFAVLLPVVFSVEE